MLCHQDYIGYKINDQILNATTVKSEFKNINQNWKYLAIVNLLTYCQKITQNLGAAAMMGITLK